jgi:hypothetical protein
MEPRLPLAIDNLRSRALFDSPPPAELFHYTDLDGMSGILESRFLWLSKISTLNDTSEINLAVHHFKVLAQEAAGALPREEAQVLVEAAEHLDHFRRTNICVGSFCEEEDQLAQWRSYGNDGRGLAIGFASARLAAIARQHDVRLVRCVYQPEHHVQITKDLAGLLLDAYRHAPPAGDEQRAQLLTQFISTFLLIAPVIKDSHFGLEREWRLVSLPRPADDHRLTAVLSGNQASVRFVLPLFAEGDNETDVISTVVIGPTVDPENIADAVDVLARHRGFRIPAIRYSRIPYRPRR